MEEREQEVGEVAWHVAGSLQHSTSGMAVGVGVRQHACSCLQVWTRRWRRRKRKCVEEEGSCRRSSCWRNKVWGIAGCVGGQ